MLEAWHPTHDSQVGEFGGHSSFTMKSVQLALNQSCVWQAVWAGAPFCWNMYLHSEP